jgi:lysine 2,3-aminomutase
MDLAPGTAHLRTGIAQGQALMRGLRASASGLCQPDYVLDIPGGYAKARLAESDIEDKGAFHRVRDAEGALHIYPPGADAP